MAVANGSGGNDGSGGGGGGGGGVLVGGGGGLEHLDGGSGGQRHFVGAVVVVATHLLLLRPTCNIGLPHAVEPHRHEYDRQPPDHRARWSAHRRLRAVPHFRVA